MSGRPAARADNADDPDATDLAKWAVSALVDAAELTPKPALVDKRGSGVAPDLDLRRVLTSAMALKNGFVAIADESASAPRASERLREQLGRIGREMERRMPTAADGGAVHRGAIWALGLLVASAARRRHHDRTAISVAAGASAIASMSDRFAPNVITQGDRARVRFGAAGARGEAQAAFPHVIRVGLPALRAARERALSVDEARLDALVAIMSTLEDTSLLQSGGRVALGIAQVGAVAVLRAGGTTTKQGRQLLARLDEELRTRRAAPKGSMVVLSATLFLDRLVE